MASNSQLVIFNNTYNSWKEIAMPMIWAGCRGYIGTVWSISNKTAMECSCIFYNRVFDMNIIEALY